MTRWWLRRTLLRLTLLMPALAPVAALAQDEVDEQSEYTYFKSVQDDMLKQQQDAETLDGRFRLFGAGGADQPIAGARSHDPLGGLGSTAPDTPLGGLGGRGVP